MADDKSLEALLLNATPDQLNKFRDKIDSKISDEYIKEAQKKKEKIIVDKFEDTRVEPFSRQAVYDVFNKVNKETTAMNGEMVIGLFGGSDDEKKAFENKVYGYRYEIKSYVIKFRHFEIN